MQRRDRQNALNFNASSPQLLPNFRLVLDNQFAPYRHGRLRGHDEGSGNTGP
jgi:hypothetical protein